MFTGLIEEKGKILEIFRAGESMNIRIQAKSVISNIKKGDSIAVNGVCLTAIAFDSSGFTADVMPETFRRTNLNLLQPGNPVNLEKSLTLSDPLGGHLVTGDVDCTGVISKIEKEGIAVIYEITFPSEYSRYIVQKGRLSVDGASLTVMREGTGFAAVSLIPHTQNMIVLGGKKVGDTVNVETDLIGKYIEKFMGNSIGTDKIEKKSALTFEKLIGNGF